MSANNVQLAKWIEGVRCLGSEVEDNRNLIFVNSKKIDALMSKVNRIYVDKQISGINYFLKRVTLSDGSEWQCRNFLTANPTISAWREGDHVTIKRTSNVFTIHDYEIRNHTKNTFTYADIIRLPNDQSNIYKELA